MIELKLMTSNTNSKKINLNSRLIIGLIGVILFTGWLYCTEVVKSPENVFWASLNNNLSTVSVVRLIEQKQTGLEVSRRARVSSGEQLSLRSIVDIKQTTPKNKVTKVKSENIITKDKNVARYVSIKSDTKINNIKRIENKWFLDPSSEEQNLNSIYEALGLTPGYITGSPPFILLGNNSKAVVLPKLRDVYKPNFTSVKKINIDGKQTYEYEVEVNVSNYVRFLQSIREQLGLDGLGLNPEDYEQNEPLKIVIAITVNGRQIIKINDKEQNRQESYSNYGVISNIQIPEPEIPKEIIDATLR